MDRIKLFIRFYIPLVNDPMGECYDLLGAGGEPRHIALSHLF